MNWKATTIVLVGVIILGGLLNWQVTENQKLTNENESLNSQLSASLLLNKVTQSAITLRYQISLDNIKARQLEDSEHVKVKTVIKTVLKDNECANTAVPDDVVSELRKYKRGIDSRSVATDTGTPNRWLSSARYSRECRLGWYATTAYWRHELNSKVQRWQKSDTRDWIS
nr:hypothetical protein [Providencia rettgeri]